MRLPKLAQWDRVEVVWEDAHGGDSGAWETLSPDLLKLEVVTTVGQFYAKDDRAICVILSRTARNHADAYLTIPMVNVRSVHKL